MLQIISTGYCKKKQFVCTSMQKNLRLYTQRNDVLILEGKGRRIQPSPQTENSI